MIRRDSVSGADLAGQHAGLQVSGLHKRFGGLKVFENIDLDLKPGEVLGIIGPNGAGKTTLINVISGQISATSGVIRLNGQDVSGSPFHSRSHKGLVRSFQHTNPFKSATVKQNLDRAMLFGRGNATRAADRLPVLLQRFGLQDRLHQSSEMLPYGLQKLLGLLMAYATEPRIMLLDEPAAGLERSERTMVDDLVADAVEHLGCGVLIVEHDMDLVRRLCPRIMVLDGGRILAQGPTAEVLQREEVIRAYLGTTDEAEHEHVAG